MAQTASVIVGSHDRARLAAIIGDRNRPLKYTQRANIILLSATRLRVLEVARRAGVSRPRGLALATALRRAGHRWAAA